MLYHDKTLTQIKTVQETFILYCFRVCVLYLKNGLLGKGRLNLSNLERLGRPFPSKPLLKYKTHTQKLSKFLGVQPETIIVSGCPIELFKFE